jgi:hypothetical protein
MQAPTGSIQSVFLEQLKKNLPKNVSFVDELAELLAISRDSAYRRIRSETILSLDEVKVLTDHFKVSIDTLISPASNQVTFQLNALNQKDFSLEKWFGSILGHLETISSFPQNDKEMIFDSKDLPIFFYFQFPRLAAFKIYFWMKSFTTEPISGKYDSEKVDKKLITMGEKIWSKYSQIQSTEIIRYELITVTLRQIEYLSESGMFLDQKEAKNLLDDCSQLVSHLQIQSKHGSKITYGSDEDGAKFILYLNEVLIGSNTIFFKLGEQRVTFITPNNFDILMTTDVRFCHLTEDHISNLIDKSILISVSAEKERNKFFNKIEESIQELRKRLS